MNVIGSKFAISKITDTKLKNKELETLLQAKMSCGWCGHRYSNRGLCSNSSKQDNMMQSCYDMIKIMHNRPIISAHGNNMWLSLYNLSKYEICFTFQCMNLVLLMQLTCCTEYLVMINHTITRPDIISMVNLLHIIHLYRGSTQQFHLTQWGWVMHICIGKLSHK